MGEGGRGAEADTSPTGRWALTNKILTSKAGNAKENHLKTMGQTQD